MKHVVVISLLLVSSVALAGGGLSKMQSDQMGRGCTDARFQLNRQPIDITIPFFVGGGNNNNSVPNPQSEVPQGPNESETKGNDLRNHFSSFNTISGRPDDIAVETFITNTTKILIRWPEHNPIAKRRWSSEGRLVYKILFGSICYVGNPGDTEVRDWLVREGLTQQDFEDLNQIYQGAGVHRAATMAACMMGGGGFGLGGSVSECDPMRSVVKRFVERF